ncbi:MAG: pyridoxal-phosphate dependent enzyme [Lachnospiraceae bacterium]|nr:pyridoxal-phosphate dependent enzyme [Lachnospiraceae bacterium]
MRQIALLEKGFDKTPVEPLSGNYGDNRFFMKRDDMIPFSFGGNKARKAAEFYKEIKKSKADVVMTYGSNSSNHCRITANMAAAMGLSCHIISPEENREILYNTRLVEQFGAVIETCPVTQVAGTIKKRKAAYFAEGKTPYFITGGGHGNPGTESYVKAYREIAEYEKENQIYFDYIFHASGTGATQAGLVCGKLLFGDQKRKIVGISIAREEARGRQVVKESIGEYLGRDFERLYREEDLIFTDTFRLGGYGQYNEDVAKTIKKVMMQEGIPMDSTYVGKAFWGMCRYLQENDIKDKNILFIHTGGTPLFFDFMDRQKLQPGDAKKQGKG